MANSSTSSCVYTRARGRPGLAPGSRIALFLCIAVSIPGQGACQESSGDPAADSVIRQIRGAHGPYVHFLTHGRCEITSTGTVLTDAEYVLKVRLAGLSFREVNDRIATHPSALHHQYVRLRNSRYSALLSRKERAGELVVRTMGAAAAETTEDKYGRYFKSILYPIGFRERRLTNWLDTPGFRITSVSGPEANGEVCLHVVHTGPPGPIERSPDVSFAGQIWLRPSQSWAIARLKLTLQLPQDDGTSVAREYDSTCTFSNGSSARPFPLEVKHTVGPTSSGAVQLTESWTIRDAAHEVYPESDFTLSAFGLPEPYGVEWERPTPWWLYTLFSAGVLFVVAVIVSFWKRRLAAQQAA